ncbi:progranulin-like [Parasteatoda tepidariorum]|uniref:progranulin-like n=1 Tax=Parasteatoda tepidariorum TaxID=114398 RepID=UPI0039BC41AE
MKFLIIVLLVAVVSSFKHQCPDPTYSCDDSATCCKVFSEIYGCCPLLNAVCCDDQQHCCPANTKCSARGCIQQTSRGVTSFLANPIRAKNVTCPGGHFTCPDDTTCCEGSARWIRVLKWSQVQSSFVCPGSSFQCPDVFTCCKLPGDEWGCCPFENATCCVDKLHCCPEGMTCGATSTHCCRGFYNVTSVRNVPAVSVKSELIIRPDHSQCQDSMICCQLKNYKYGYCH